jgi:choloylglycine hydrolase
MCTGIFIKTENNEYVVARTLEFGIPINFSQICSDFLFATKGNFIGSKKEYIFDGLNKFGLFIGVFYYPHMDSQYKNQLNTDLINLYNGNFAPYVLLNCKNVADVIEILPKINILQSIVNGNKYSLHWLVCDKFGKCIVIEVNNNKLIYYNNPYGCITNSPSFPEHIQELNSLKNLSIYTKPNSWSEGTGALGLPGDFSSKSRFIRAVFFRENLPIPENSLDGMRILNNTLTNFNIPLGSVVNPSTNSSEVTQYTVSYSLNNFQVQYANRGFTYNKKNEWKFTKEPVDICWIQQVNIWFLIFFIIVIIGLVKNKHKEIPKLPIIKEILDVLPFEIII